jgi:drug/metabolite transporter (DMT)-like permease
LVGIQSRGALIGAGNTILDKKLAMRPDMPPLIYTASFGVVSVPVVMIGLLLLPAISWPMALAAILAGILFMVAAWLYYGVMAKEDVSQVTLLMRLTGIETMILSAFFLGERLTFMQCSRGHS